MSQCSRAPPVGVTWIVSLVAIVCQTTRDLRSSLLRGMVKGPGGDLSLAMSLGLEAECLLDRWLQESSPQTEIKQSVVSDLQLVIDEFDQDAAITADFIEGPVSRIAKGY